MVLSILSCSLSNHTTDKKGNGLSRRSLVVNNPLRIVEQRLEIGRLRAMRSFRQGATILEVGCGRGAGARLILKTFKPSRLYALDLDIEMVRKAKDYLSGEEIKRAFLHVGDALCLPLKDE